MSDNKQAILIVTGLIALLVIVLFAALTFDRKELPDPLLSHNPDANWVEEVIYLNGDPDSAYTKRRGGAFVKEFAEGHDPENWYLGDFAMNIDWQKAGWKREHITFDGEKVKLEIDREPMSPNHPYSGAEYQNTAFFGFGRYEVVMMPAKGSGIVSSYYTYTGGMWEDPSHEIDIEFVGKDTRKVQYNYFYEGVPAGAIHIDLDYDASEEAHLYAYEWSADSVKWYIDDKLVHTSKASGHPIPQYPGRIFLSVWSGSENQYGWHGPPTFKDGANAKYFCTSYQPAGEDTAQCSDTWLEKIPVK